MVDKVFQWCKIKLDLINPKSHISTFCTMTSWSSSGSVFHMSISAGPMWRCRRNFRTIQVSTFYLDWEYHYWTLKFNFDSSNAIENIITGHWSLILKAPYDWEYNYCILNSNSDNSLHECPQGMLIIARRHRPLSWSHWSYRARSVLMRMHR